MDSFKGVGNYLFSKQLTWLEIFLLLVLGLFTYSHNLNELDFYVDENPWIYESAALNSFLGGDFSPELWEDDYNGMLDPPVAKYLIGIGLNLGGLSIESLPRWDWTRDYQSNFDRGCVPSKEILWWSRIPMVVTSILGLILAAFLIGKAHSRLAAFIFYGFSLTHFTYPLRQAMSEAPLIFFTFLAGLAGYYGMIALAGKQTKAAFLRFSIFGILTGLATASKLNAVTISVAGILGIGFVLFWKRTGEIRQGLKLAVQLTLIQAYLIVTVFILINPYLYTTPFRKIVLMFIARTFTIQVQMQMYPQSVVSGANWLQVVPNRIFGQLATPAYPGHSFVNILLFLIGLYVMLQVLWNTLPGWKAALVLGTFSIALAVPGLLSPLDWDRYYVYPVIFSRVFIAIGAVRTFSALFSKFCFTS